MLASISPEEMNRRKISGIVAAVFSTGLFYFLYSRGYPVTHRLVLLLPVIFAVFGIPIFFELQSFSQASNNSALAPVGSD